MKLNTEGIYYRFEVRCEMRVALPKLRLFGGTGLLAFVVRRVFVVNLLEPPPSGGPRRDRAGWGERL